MYTKNFHTFTFVCFFPSVCRPAPPQTCFTSRRNVGIRDSGLLLSDILQRTCHLTFHWNDGRGRRSACHKEHSFKILPSPRAAPNDKMATAADVEARRQNFYLLSARTATSATHLQLWEQKKTGAQDLSLHGHGVRIYPLRLYE